MQSAAKLHESVGLPQQSDKVVGQPPGARV
jgi:hypothetical protein